MIAFWDMFLYKFLSFMDDHSKKAEKIHYRSLLITRGVKSWWQHNADHSNFNVQVGEVAVPTWCHMLFFFFLLSAPVLPSVQVWGEATFSH
jgi:hypothetical protein